MNNKVTLNLATRGSKLALLQADFVKKKFENIFDFIKIDIVEISTPGDRDKNLDLQAAPSNFFTEDIDNMVISGKVDFAVHSAKDLPELLPDEIDWFWLPWKEDPRDAILVRDDFSVNSKNPVIGVSSKRREEYALKRWPEAVLKPIRGNIDERIQQLDDKKFDIIVTAVAALNRLSLTNRINEYIPLEQLPTPEGQGNLAITYRKNNYNITTLRNYFINPVILAGAGPGNPEFTTAATVDALRECDICFYDALMSKELLALLPATAINTYIGKREGIHSAKQEDICSALSIAAKQMQKVVRLKGGDPGLFGRLEEEVSELEREQIPFKVIPGISSMTAATTCTGFLLTKRNQSRGFSAATFRVKGSGNFVPIADSESKKQPSVYFMSTSVINELIEELLAQGYSKDDKIAIIYNVSSYDEQIITGTLNNINELIKTNSIDGPGIIIFGSAADKNFIYKNFGLLSGEKVLITATKTITDKACDMINHFCGISIKFPLTKQILIPFDDGFLSKLHTYDWIILSSPTSIKLFMNYIIKNMFDLRKLPKIIVSGSQSKHELMKYGINADLIAKSTNAASEIVTLIGKNISKKDKILRVRSDAAGSSIYDSLNQAGFNIDEKILYKTEHIKYEKLPEFHSVIFASSSAVNSFFSQFSKVELLGKKIIVLGDPTKNELTKYIETSTVLMPDLPDIKNCVRKIALENVKLKITGTH